jgi:hypothetical protein
MNQSSIDFLLIAGSMMGFGLGAHWKHYPMSNITNQ